MITKYKSESIHPESKDLVRAIKLHLQIKTDTELARLIGVHPNRISQMKRTTEFTVSKRLIYLLIQHIETIQRQPDHGS